MLYRARELRGLTWSSKPDFPCLSMLRAASIGEAAFLFLAARSGNAGRGVALHGQARPPKQEKTCMTTKSVKSDTRLDTVKRTVTLRGLTPIMFDRYAGDNTTKLEWSQKIYLIPGTNVL